MESALYGIYALVVFLSEHPFENTSRALFPWSNLYAFGSKKLEKRSSTLKRRNLSAFFWLHSFSDTYRGKTSLQPWSELLGHKGNNL